jgi:NhaP-type Na+/H+ or K+/H+ antiporter
MIPEGFATGAVTVGIALAAGVLGQVIARHIQMPSIVVLLAVGVMLGPDVAGVVRPALLGDALQTLVGFAVAIILFEGGMNLDMRRLRAEALAIRRLVTIGAIITAVGGALAARLLMGWDWRLSALFGTLVIVTGPTVVTPLLRRLRVKDPVNTVLQAEGVLIDSIGAIIAVVTLEVLFSEEASTTGGIGTAAFTLGSGAVMGLLAGSLIALLLRRPNVVPVGLENILVLSFAAALFQISDAVQPESGLAAVTVAGVTVGNTRIRGVRELIDFKEQITVMMIGLLFVLLAADVRLGSVAQLGWPALATVFALMLVVRPVQAWLCTIGTSLNARERLFIATLAPRGIVAAAVASLFAQQLANRGLPVGEDLRALVFLLIAVTVLLHGLTGGWIAGRLGLRRASKNGFVILGANALARAVGRVLRDDDHEVVLIDSNVDPVSVAEKEGFRAIWGQGLQTPVLASAEVETRLGCLGLTPNEEINLLFVRKVREETREPQLWVALRRSPGAVEEEHVLEAHASVLFGGERRLVTWAQRLDDGATRIERWSRAAASTVTPTGATPEDRDWLLVIGVRRRGRMQPYDTRTQLTAKEEIAVLIWDEQRAATVQWLRHAGWTPVSGESPALADQRA